MMIRTSGPLRTARVDGRRNGTQRLLSQQRHRDQQQQQHSRFRGRGGGRPPSAGKRQSPGLTTTNSGEAVPRARGELLFGVHSVLQALASGHRKAHALYVRDGHEGGGQASKKPTDRAALDKIKALAADADLQVTGISKWMLNHITNDKPHQGVVLDADSLTLDEFDTRSLDAIARTSTNPVILALDELQDTQNLGAILRSAHFLGCAGVILCDRNCAPASPAVSRASAGALEVLAANNKIWRAKNLHQALAVSRDNGWRVVGACSGPNSVSSNNLSSGQPTILVMGNEHRGMRKTIRHCCDQIVSIPGLAAEEDSCVDSLNVSVATAILLYELLHH